MEHITYSKNGQYEYSCLRGRRACHWYAQQMIERVVEMAPHATRILLLGLAGGAMAIDLASRLPRAHITAVDIDESFVVLAKHMVQSQFSDLASRIHIVHADAKTFVKQSKSTFDVVLCDVFVDTDVPAFVQTLAFTQAVRNHLSRHGLYIVNTIAPSTTDAVLSAMLRSKFQVSRQAQFALPIAQSSLCIGAL